MRAALVGLGLVLALAACTTGSSPASPDAAVVDALRVACDGHLCDTTNGASCDAGAGGAGLAVAAAIALAARRRRAR